MTLAVPYKRTMAGAKWRGRESEPVSTPKRDRVIKLAQRWNRENHLRKMKAEISALDRKLDVAIERSRFPIVPFTSPNTIIQQVGFWHGLTVHEILSDSRLIPIVEARFDAIVAVRINCRIGGKRPGLMDLARLFNRDHTSIISALRQRGLRG
jgi:chromosomal replication initiation ATPase DnaA